MSPKRSRLKLAVFWFGLFAIVGVLFLAGMEVFLRIALRQTLTAETGFPLVASDVPGLAYRLAPNHAGDGIQTDSHGFRIRPAGPVSAHYSILVLGDSISFGSGVSYRQSYVPALETRLSAGLEEPTAVWNAAVPGYNTSQEAAMLEQAAPYSHPDVVVLQFCMNDYLDAPTLTPGGNLDQSSSIAEAPSFSPIAFLYHSKALVFLKEKLKDVQRARPEWFPVWAHYIHYINRKPGWQRAKEALLQVQQSSNRIRAGFLVVIFPVEQQLRIGDRTAQDDLMQFTRAHGIDTLDLYDSFRARWKERLYIDYWEQVKQVDKLHPNARGHALAAEQITDYMLARRSELFKGKAPSTSSTALLGNAQRTFVQ
jgi:lysophospholipase L1-like esterase